MEPRNSYEHFNEFYPDEHNEAGYQPEKPKTGLAGRQAEFIQGKLSPLVMYTLLGVSLLLSIVILSIVVNLRNSEKTNSSLAELQREVSRLRENLYPVQPLNKWRLFKQRLYYFRSTRAGWNESQNFCTSMNSNLVVINNGDELEYIRLNANCAHWIGLHDTAEEGTWRWVDGTDYASNIKFWASNQPNGDERWEEDCAVVSEDGLWHDWPCNSQHFAICEKPTE
ncbi:hepatic lectin-like [Pristis pectinata]|uniref:hepatic lectin-like n=1 Tax=Pristis pectinata TaxID=685728 RepID=UPI00223D155D|nr:hepatic lectin-like [Pristis pectinata]